MNIKINHDLFTSCFGYFVLLQQALFSITLPSYVSIVTMNFGYGLLVCKLHASLVTELMAEFNEFFKSIQNIPNMQVKLFQPMIKLHKPAHGKTYTSRV